VFRRREGDHHLVDLVAIDDLADIGKPPKVLGSFDAALGRDAPVVVERHVIRQPRDAVTQLRLVVDVLEQPLARTPGADHQHPVDSDPAAPEQLPAEAHRQALGQ